MTMRRAIPGRLDLDAMAILSGFPNAQTRDELQRDVQGMAGRGISEQDIAAATNLSVELVRQLLVKAPT